MIPADHPTHRHLTNVRKHFAVELSFQLLSFPLHAAKSIIVKIEDLGKMSNRKSSDAKDKFWVD